MSSANLASLNNNKPAAEPAQRGAGVKGTTAAVTAEGKWTPFGLSRLQTSCKVVGTACQKNLRQIFEKVLLSSSGNFFYASEIRM